MTPFLGSSNQGFSLIYQKHDCRLALIPSAAEVAKVEPEVAAMPGGPVAQVCSCPVLARLRGRTCKNRGATRVSATVGNAAAVASSAMGSPSCSIKNPVVTKRFNQLLNVRWNRGTRKGGMVALSSAGASPKCHSSTRPSLLAK